MRYWLGLVVVLAAVSAFADYQEGDTPMVIPRGNLNGVEVAGSWGYAGKSWVLMELRKEGHRAEAQHDPEHCREDHRRVICDYRDD